MGENFQKLKRKALRIRLLKAILLALSTGLGAVGIGRLLTNYAILPLDLPFLILIAAGIGLFSGAVLFFAMHKSELRFAKQLDRTLGLSERLQTMLEYRDDASPMAEMQRADANEALAAIPSKKLKYKRLWLYCLLLLLGGGMLAASFFLMPELQVDEPEPEIPFAVSEIQLAALEELTAQVKSSEMTSPYREDIVEILETLLTEIRHTATVKEMESTVNASIGQIATITDDASGALELLEALWSTEEAHVRSLVQALNYYAWTSFDDSDKFDNLIDTFRASLKHSDDGKETADAEKMKTDTAKLLSQVSVYITLSISECKLPGDDPLAILLTRLTDANDNKPDGTHLWGLSVITAKELDYEKMQSEIDVTLNMLRGELLHALEIHAENTGTGEYAMTKLADIFDCPYPALKRPNLPNNGEGEDSSDRPNGPGGGVGGGGTIFGSDDLVYDPLTGNYVEYGEILSRYQERKNNIINSGVYSKEDMDAVERYFNILQSGFGPGN